MGQSRKRSGHQAWAEAKRFGKENCSEWWGMQVFAQLHC